MKYILSTLMMVVIVATCALAQNKDLDAQYLYTQAENSYFKNEFEDCVKFCEKAASTLGETNPKILLLQFNAYDALLKQCRKNELLNDIVKIDTYLDYFFSHIDIQTYPKEKYFEAMKFKDDYNKKDDYDNRNKDINVKRYSLEDLGIVVEKDYMMLKVIEVHEGLIKDQTDMKTKFEIDMGSLDDINKSLKESQDHAIFDCQDFFTFKITGVNMGKQGVFKYQPPKTVTYELKLPTYPK